eukprot:2995239-Ditylum_brightwellii.AAC.1
MAATINGFRVLELPSLNFVRQCHVVLQTLNTILAAYCLGRAAELEQIFMDGTTRQQIAFQDLVIGIKENGKLDPVIVSSCICLEDELSEMQTKTITTE